MDTSAVVTAYYTRENTSLHFISGSPTIAIVDIIVGAVAVDTVSLMAPGHQVLQLVCEVSSFNHDLIFVMLYQCSPILCLHIM